MNHLLLTSCLLLGTLSATCQINVDYDRSVDFSKYRTFAFAPGTIMRKLGLKDSDGTLINRNVNVAVTEVLTKKGMAFAETGADLTITFMAGAKEKKEIESYPITPGVGYRYGFRRFYGAGGWWGPAWNNWWVNRYEQGTLILDIYDNKTKELVWRAYAVANIRNYDERKFVDRQVEKALKHFPPREKHASRNR